jgi:hypothetical protein
MTPQQAQLLNYLADQNKQLAARVEQLEKQIAELKGQNDTRS